MLWQKKLQFVDSDDQIRADGCAGFAGDALIHVDAIGWVIAV